MFRVPVDVRKIVLVNLDCVDYLSALESCKYWYSSRDAKHYEEQKKVYLREMEKRKLQETFDEATASVKHIFAEDNGILQGMPSDFRDQAVNLLESDMFRNLMTTMIGTISPDDTPQELVQKIDMKQFAAILEPSDGNN